jgi:Zn-dependent peptidase ImmA (M78 family)
MLITPVPNLKPLTGAEAFILGNLSEILYDQACFDNRIRFSIAEEVGHYELHNKQIRLLRSNSTYEEWINTITEIPEEVWTRADIQAKEFAGRLLVPKENLIQSVKCLEPEINKAKEILKDGINKAELFSYIGPAIAKHFQVSDQVIYIRLIHEEIEKCVDFLNDLR